MPFQFDKNIKPDPIPVEWEDGSFKLLHRWMNASARIKVQEAVAAGIASAAVGQIADAENMGLGFATAQRVLGDHIIGWEGVTDESGNLMPFHEKDRNTDVKKSNLDLVMGRVPFEVQLKVMMIQLAMNGIRISGQYIEIIGRLLHDYGFAEKMGEEIKGFFRKPAAKAGDSSTSSSTTETSTTPSE